MKKERLSEFFRAQRARYDTHPSTHCPALRADVIFNAKGFHHLQSHTDGKMRTVKEQLHKINLLPFVVQIIKTASHVEHRNRMAPAARKKVDGKKVIKNVDYWSITGTPETSSEQIKIILRKVGNGQLHFWSVMKLKKRKVPRSEGL